jgi:hypothetical protein
MCHKYPERPVKVHFPAALWGMLAMIMRFVPYNCTLGELLQAENTLKQNRIAGERRCFVAGTL